MYWTAVKLSLSNGRTGPRECLGHNLVTVSPDYHAYEWLHCMGCLRDELLPDGEMPRSHLTWCVWRGLGGDEGYTHTPQKDCLQYINVSKVMIFQHPGCKVISFRGFGEHHRKTMQVVAC